MINASNGEDDNDESANQPGVDNSLDGDPLEQEHLCRVLLIDAMATLQGIKKSTDLTPICHLKDTFVKKVMNMSRRYDEVRVLFSHYLEDSFKPKTRADRATSEISGSKQSKL